MGRISIISVTYIIYLTVISTNFNKGNTLRNFIHQEIQSKDQLLKLDHSQKENLIPHITVWYNSIISIQLKRNAKSITKLRYDLELDFAEYNYLKSLEDLLNNTQKQRYRKVILPEKEEEKSVKIFKRTGLIQYCDLHD